MRTSTMLNLKKLLAKNLMQDDCNRNGVLRGPDYQLPSYA